MSERLPRLRWFAHHWNLFWFTPTRASNLGLSRILFYALFFRLYGFRDYSLWADVDPVFWFPMHLFEILGWGPLSADGLAGLSLVWKVAMLLSLVGLFTRFSTVVAFGLALYFLGLPHNFGKLHHSDALGLLIFGALALSRCGDAWSVDRWWARRRGTPDPAPSGEYRWPVQFVRVAMVTAFFAAGVSKLRASGLEWVFSDNIRLTILWHYYNFEPPVDWGLRLAQVGWVCKGLALSSLGLELAAPLALLGGWPRRLLIPGLYGMQLGFWLLMGISFPPYLLCYYLFWVRWDRVVERWRPRTPVVAPAG